MKQVQPGAEALSSSLPVLSARNLQKDYDGRPALRGLSFTLQPGHILGFLGPNGAGKTTAIRILTTILEPSSGEFSVDGVSSRQPQAIRRKIGVLPESLGFPQQMTATEYLVYFGRHYGHSSPSARTNAAILLAEVGLSQRANSLIGSYSRGMRQRLGIARSLVNEPTVIFLDEPTLGLDPRGKQELLVLIRRIATQRHTGVILCSHLLTEVEEVCDDVVILRHGQVVARGTVAEVLQKANRGTARVHVPAELVAQAASLLGGQPEVTAVTPHDGQNNGWLSIQVADHCEPHQLNQLLAKLISADIPILNFEGENSRLQDVFFQLTEEAGV